MERAKRGIRMSDDEWAGFMKLLGPEWLRAKVRRELKKEAAGVKAAEQVNP